MGQNIIKKIKSIIKHNYENIYYHETKKKEKEKETFFHI